MSNIGIEKMELNKGIYIIDEATNEAIFFQADELEKDNFIFSALDKGASYFKTTKVLWTDILRPRHKLIERA